MWRAEPGGYGVQVALVHRPRYDDWAFPKGKANAGEHPLLTAVREVTEETGLRPVLGRPLPQISYLAKGRPKRVDYWAATPSAPRAAGISQNGGASDRAQAVLATPGQAEFVPNDQFVPNDEFVPNEEVDKLDWLPVAEAEQRLSYEHDVHLLREFAGAPASTVSYIFLRHASAVAKEGWPDNDLLRPLDEAGRAQAHALAELLACFGQARVFSSAAARCVETVLPYSVHVGVPASAEPEFTGFAPEGVAAARARLGELLVDCLPMIFCGHRETLPALYAQAVTQFGAAPPADLSLAKGSFSVLHVTGGAPAAGAGGAASLVATEQHDVTAPFS